MKRFVTLTTAALVFGAAHSSLRGDAVSNIAWDPDGSGNSPSLNLVTFQFGAGNSLLQGSIPFTQGDQFQLLFHAQLNSVVVSSGAQVTPLGLNATGSVGAVAPFEVTLVGNVTEAVTNVNNTPARIAYRVAGNQAPGSFIELYYDAAQNANPLQGTGYNDGRLILRGAPVPADPDVGTFALSNPQPATAPSLDLFGANDYLSGTSNVTSVQGIGATRMDIAVTFVDPAFFVAAGAGAHQVQVGDVITLDLSHSAPFDKVDPSRRFDGTANAGTGSGPAPSATPRLGAGNGTTGPDFQTQTLAAATVRGSTSGTPTPTPSGTPTPTPSGTPTPTPTPSGSPTPTPGPVRVIVGTNKTSLREGNDAIITFAVRGSTTHPALTVNYSVAGTATLNTDFTLSGTPGSVIIPANAPGATITLHAVTDTVAEPNGEVAKIIVEAGTGYSVPTQQDAKRVVVTILDPGT